MFYILVDLYYSMTYGTSTEILSFRRFFDGLAGKCWRSFHLDPRRQCAVWFCVSRVTKITAFHIFHGLWRGIGDRAEILPHWTRLVDARKKFVLATPWAEGLAEPSPDVMKFFFFFVFEYFTWLHAGTGVDRPT